MSLSLGFSPRQRLTFSLKAFIPVAILLISFIFRIQDPNRRLFAIVMMISGGVSLASYGELKFDTLGFIIQALAVCVCLDAISSS